jgi:hypothetical protein
MLEMRQCDQQAACEVGGAKVDTVVKSGYASIDAKIEHRESGARVAVRYRRYATIDGTALVVGSAL